MMVAAVIVRLLLAVIFLRAALHKLRDYNTFQTEMSTYQLLPRSWLSVAAVLLIILEAAAGILLMNPVWVMGLCLAALLLSIYAIAMMINLLKGRRTIDCGCGGPLAAKKTISWSLVIRNGVLALLALLCTTSLLTRSLDMLEVFIIFSGVAASLLIYEAIEQAIANSQNYQRWQAQRAEKPGVRH